MEAMIGAETKGTSYLFDTDELQRFLKAIKRLQNELQMQDRASVTRITGRLYDDGSGYLVNEQTGQIIYTFAQIPDAISFCDAKAVGRLVLAREAMYGAA